MCQVLGFANILSVISFRVSLWRAVNPNKESRLQSCAGAGQAQFSRTVQGTSQRCQRQQIRSLKHARRLTLQKMANAMDQGPAPFREWVVKHLPARHWLYAIKDFFKGIDLHFGNVSLAEDKGKTEV